MEHHPLVNNQPHAVEGIAPDDMVRCVLEALYFSETPFEHAAAQLGLERDELMRMFYDLMEQRKDQGLRFSTEQAEKCMSIAFWLIQGSIRPALLSNLKTIHGVRAMNLIDLDEDQTCCKLTVVIACDDRPAADVTLTRLESLLKNDTGLQIVSGQKTHLGNEPARKP